MNASKSLYDFLANMEWQRHKAPLGFRYVATSSEASTLFSSGCNKELGTELFKLGRETGFKPSWTETQLYLTDDNGCKGATDLLQAISATVEIIPSEKATVSEARPHGLGTEIG